MNVLVTGGTGFVGSAIVRHLLAANYEVRVMARCNPERSKFLLEGLNVEIFDGDITNTVDVKNAVKGCSVIIHTASAYTFHPFWKKRVESMYEINVQGTRNLLYSALENKVKKFIYTSTVATIGPESDGKLSNENTDNFKNTGNYSHSKYLAEQEVLKFCRKGLPGIILNPGLIFGERDYKPTATGEIIVNLLNRNYPGYFKTTWAVADVNDIAKAHIAAIDCGRVGERYILCNKKFYTMKDICKLLEEVSGTKTPRINVPYFFLEVFIHIEELVSYKILKKRALFPTEGVHFCRKSCLCDNSKAVRELGYTETPFKETLAAAVSWYKNNGYVKSCE